jgi:hypothetical protein
VIVTVAPEITEPLASVTLPTMRPVAIWAETLEIEAVTAKAQTKKTIPAACLRNSVSVFSKKNHTACDSSVIVDTLLTTCLVMARHPCI